MVLVLDAIVIAYSKIFASVAEDSGSRSQSGKAPRTMSNLIARQHAWGLSARFQSIVFKRKLHRTSCRWVESSPEGLPITATNSRVLNITSALHQLKSITLYFKFSGARTAAKRFWKTVGIEHHSGTSIFKAFFNSISFS